MSEQAVQINEERLKKFRNMGIPAPLPPVDPASMKNLNANPDKLKQLEAIRNGAKRGEFKEILSKTEPKQLFTPLPNPKQKHNPNAPKPEIVVPIQSFSSDSKADKDARLLESALFGEDPRSTAYSEPIQTVQNNDIAPTRMPRILPEEINPNDDLHGTEFLQNFKARMAAKVGAKSPASPGIQVVQSPVRQSVTQVKSLSEEEIERKIISIATSISKAMIKEVISEYAKDGSGIIIEGKNIKKAELVGNGVVKIAGKIYKLVPVKQQV